MRASRFLSLSVVLSLALAAGGCQPATRQVPIAAPEPAPARIPLPMASSDSLVRELTGLDSLLAKLHERSVFDSLANILGQALAGHGPLASALAASSQSLDSLLRDLNRQSAAHESLLRAQDATARQLQELLRSWEPRQP